MASQEHANAGGCAVALTYDGSLPCHLYDVVPVLECFDLKATFFADNALLVRSPGDWTSVRRLGHEIGNGSILAAALPDGTLPAWTPSMVVEEVLSADELLHEFFPEQPRPSFAFPLGHPLCAGNADFSTAVRSLGMPARSGVAGFNHAETEDFGYLRCIPAHDCTGAQLIAYAQAALRRRALAVFCFGEVGFGDGAVSRQAHRELCRWLADNPNLAQVHTLAAWAAAKKRTPRSAIELR